MTSTETVRTLLDAAIGHEGEWRDEMVASWLGGSGGSEQCEPVLGV
jgi:hypothetical protein